MNCFVDKKKILIVDDEEDITFIFKIILEDAGFEVETYNDPQKALNNFKKNFYNLVLLDLKLPVLSGIELYYKILEIDNCVKICFLTSSDQITLFSRREDIVPPNINVIRKPIENGFFIQKVMELIDCKM